MSAAVSQESWRPIATGPVIMRLPVPPSVNNLFVNTKGGRYTSPHYKAWKVAAGLELNVQRPHRFVGKVELVITIQEPPRPCDLDNRQKAVIDLLVTHGVIPTDNSTCVRKITASWGPVFGCVIEIIPCATIVARAAA